MHSKIPAIPRDGECPLELVLDSRGAWRRFREEGLYSGDGIGKSTLAIVWLRLLMVAEAMRFRGTFSLPPSALKHSESQHQ